MADVDFFWDPVCPWAWLTSRWVAVVAERRKLAVDWRFISLRLVNADRDYETEFPKGYPEGHGRGLRLLRVAAAVRAEVGPDRLFDLYTAFGTTIHLERQQRSLDSRDDLARVLTGLGLPPSLADAADDERWTSDVQADTDLALARAGRGLGTPIITFGPPDGPSFFGPVVSEVPDERAEELWDAVQTLATFPGFAELKRSLRPALRLS